MSSNWFRNHKYIYIKAETHENITCSHEFLDNHKYKGLVKRFRSPMYLTWRKIMSIVGYFNRYSLAGNLTSFSIWNIITEYAVPNEMYVIVVTDGYRDYVAMISSYESKKRFLEYREHLVKYSYHKLYSVYKLQFELSMGRETQKKILTERFNRPYYLLESLLPQNDFEKDRGQ